MFSLTCHPLAAHLLFGAAPKSGRAMPNLSQGPHAEVDRRTLPVLCRKCGKAVTIVYTPHSQSQIVGWTCPHRSTCGSLNHLELAGHLVDVQSGLRHA